MSIQVDRASCHRSYIPYYWLDTRSLADGKARQRECLLFSKAVTRQILTGDRLGSEVRLQILYGRFACSRAYTHLHALNTTTISMQITAYMTEAIPNMAF